jgi:hypothetical protein
MKTVLFRTSVFSEPLTNPTDWPAVSFPLPSFFLSFFSPMAMGYAGLKNEQGLVRAGPEGRAGKSGCFKKTLLEGSISADLTLLLICCTTFKNPTHPSTWFCVALGEVMQVSLPSLSLFLSLSLSLSIRSHL